MRDKKREISKQESFSATLTRSYIVFILVPIHSFHTKLDELTEADFENQRKNEREGHGSRNCIIDESFQIKIFLNNQLAKSLLHRTYSYGYCCSFVQLYNTIVIYAIDFTIFLMQFAYIV